MYVIITKDQCSFCDAAKAKLTAAGKQFTVYNVQSPSSKWLLDLIKKAGYTTVPQIWGPSGEYIGGFSALDQLLTEGPV